ncbi:hypothetical protein BDQ12DRAFT_721784 [Crucibulum laeve]|uniref:Uncharacterized protein n=1 Tax=Crucibulum laeve TaxID=68775 RepID=A0A5C3M4V7_9AGAR|nr:hypothetical protein BDQ12DRAFT_721784 [Crucibulum laeve]
MASVLSGLVYGVEFMSYLTPQTRKISRLSQYLFILTQTAPTQDNPSSYISTIMFKNLQAFLLLVLFAGVIAVPFTQDNNTAKAITAPDPVQITQYLNALLLALQRVIEELPVPLTDFDPTDLLGDNALPGITL